MTIKTQAIVFSAIKFGEADLIVKCFTKDFGIKSYLLRGVLKSRKGKLRSSYFQPLTQLEITAIHKDKGTLERIQEAKVLNTYTTLHTEITKSAIVLFISEILKTAIQEEEKNENLFHFISQSLIWLDHNKAIANFHILFLLKLTSFLGFFPHLDKSNNQYFNLVDGKFQSSKTNEYCLNDDKITYFKAFFGINFDDLEHIKLTGNLRLEILNLLINYYQIHLHGFKKPKSVDVLIQLFN
jgi:DNA repair protein RecO (recombination protein O)